MPSSVSLIERIIWNLYKSVVKYLNELHKELIVLDKEIKENLERLSPVFQEACDKGAVPKLPDTEHLDYSHCTDSCIANQAKKLERRQEDLRASYKSKTEEYYRSCEKEYRSLLDKAHEQDPSGVLEDSLMSLYKRRDKLPHRIIEDMEHRLGMYQLLLSFVRDN